MPPHNTPQMIQVQPGAPTPQQGPPPQAMSVEQAQALLDQTMKANESVSVWLVVGCMVGWWLFVVDLNCCVMLLARTRSPPLLPPSLFHTLTHTPRTGPQATGRAWTTPVRASASTA